MHIRTLSKISTVLVTAILAFASAPICTGGDTGADSAVSNEYNEPGQPLPRWREGGTPYDANQSLVPKAIANPYLKDEPNSGLICSPPEYDPSRGVIFWYNSGAWCNVVRDLVASLTGDPEHDDIAHVVVTSTSQRNHAIGLFSAAGANMSQVEFIIEPGNSIWIRDYGPHFIWQDSSLGIVNSHYYSTRSLDNFIPNLLGDDHFMIPTWDMGLFYSGGNFQPGPRRSGFATSILYADNPPEEGFDDLFIAELFQTYQGIDTLHVLPQLPPGVDATGHIDMWMYLIDENTVIISEFKPGSNQEAITITENAVGYMEALGFEVYRTPAWNANHPDYGWSTHWTYTNALRVSNRIFVPEYGRTYTSYADEDAEALAAYEAAAGPDIEIIQIDCYDIIWAAGAIHCITMQVPRLTSLEPSVYVTWPNGGQLLVGGTAEPITWTATDTDNDEIPVIELYYSVDDGRSYVFIDSTTNTGLYEWTVPNIYAEQARVKVVAVSADEDRGEGVSASPFEIAEAEQTVYDFSDGAGVDKFCRGYQTSSWAGINGNRTPVTTDISTLVSGAYTRIAYSDAIGNDYDANRYTSPDPNNGWESTHIFEFTIYEDPADIDDIEVFWEGYSDQCAQVELYAWDYVEEQWCNTTGFLNQNRFMDNWAGNRDGYLEKHIRSDFERYVDGSGRLTLLLYSERGPDGTYVNYNPTFHDYISVTVSIISPQYVCGDADASADVDIDDAVFLINYIFSGGPEPVPYESGDADCSGGVDIDDTVWLINYIFSGGYLPCDTDGDDVPDC